VSPKPKYHLRSAPFSPFTFCGLGISRVTVASNTSPKGGQSDYCSRCLHGQAKALKASDAKEKLSRS